MSCASQLPVFGEHDPRVKNLGIDKFEAHLWIAGINRLPACIAKNQGKNHESEPVDESYLHHAFHQTDAAD